MPFPALSYQQRLSWLRLMRSDRIGPVSFFHFLNRFGSADNALDALPEVMARHGSKRVGKICSVEDAERELEQAEKLGVRHVAIGEAAYPALLRQIDDPPPLLLIKGNLDMNKAPMVAIVGSRNASLAGQKLSGQFAHDLALSGYFVASGLARGIDTAAHKGALKGGTVAVLAGGHGEIYPPENQSLAEAISEHNGAVISETPPWLSPRAKDFPRRNRLVSGISCGVLVVEAARRSGSLITARLAGEQNRQLFAIPGSPLDPRAEGTNHLIRQGATLVQRATDIIEDLGGQLQSGFYDGSITDGQADFAVNRFDGTDEAQQEQEPVPNIEQYHLETIINGLSATPLHIDDIVRLSGLPPQIVIGSLCELEFSGQVERLEANSFKRL